MSEWDSVSAAEATKQMQEIRIYHVFCFDYDFPEKDSYLGVATSFDDVKHMVETRQDITRDYAVVFRFIYLEKRFIEVATWYYGDEIWNIPNKDIL